MQWLCNLLASLSTRFLDFLEGAGGPERFKMNREDEEILQRRAARLAGYQQRIAAARHLLFGDGWGDSSGKEEFVRAVYEGKMPQYLWYDIGLSQPSQEEWEVLAKTFWGEQGPGWGDREIHRFGHSGVLNGLRIRSPKKFAEFIVIGGRHCPLCQTGHGDQSDEPMVFLPALYAADTAPAMTW